MKLDELSINILYIPDGIFLPFGIISFSVFRALCNYNVRLFCYVYFQLFGGMHFSRELYFVLCHSSVWF